MTRLLCLVLLLISPLASAAPASDLLPFWKAADENSTATIDHSAWADLLSTFVQPSNDGINKVAYTSFDAAASSRLDGYIDALAALDPRAYNPNEQMAYWINLYNALTIQVVLNYPDKKSILRMGERFFSVGPWDDAVVEIAGESLTLNDIEHRILRPIWADHRIHYAVNCASIGCPNLAREPYTAANLETMLAAAEAEYLRHERGISFDDRGRLTLSSIFKWYQVDFAEDEAGLLAHLAERRPDEPRLASYDGRVRYDYNWDLNTATPK